MPQPEFIAPDFIKNNSAGEIHERMMRNLPADIDDMPGGFPYDFTMPAALEKDELINYHLVRALMIAFPMYAWDEWLDLHGNQAHLTRHEAKHATGTVKVTGTVGTKIEKGTIFCTPATDAGPSIEFATTSDAEIQSSGFVEIGVKAVQAGPESNIGADTIVIMAKPSKSITFVTNEKATAGGTKRESNDAFYDRIEVEYENNLTFVGNDTDYIRWAKAAGAGDCIVIPAHEGPGTVKLILIDQNGEPASQELVKIVQDYILSPDDRSKRLLPTGCAKLTCEAAKTVLINYTITGLLYDSTTNIEQIKKEFSALVKNVYVRAKVENILRYNDIRPLLQNISGVEDFQTFLINGGTANIPLGKEMFAETGTLDFS